MRASDLALPQGMEVYVDMDGVLADFFTEYAKLAGIESGNYRDIPPAKTDPTLNKMVGTDFFARLPKFPTADKLLDIVVDAAGSYNICSSPLRGDHEGSEKYKKIWIEKHLNQQPAQIFIVSNKAKYAFNPSGLPNILIDDRGSNISAWEAAGGIGIKYQADEDSLQVILDGLKRARRVAQGEEEHEPQQLKSLDRSQGKLIATSGDKDVDESRKKKRRNKYGALYGPGPYGLYGFDAGYSGAGDLSGGDGGGGESINEAWTPDKKQRIKDFALWAIKLLEIEQAPRITLVGDTKTTALGYFDPETQNIVVSVKDRHQMDIMRTLAHELVHRKQNEARELNGETGSPDENEANALAGVLLRYWGKMNPEQFNEEWSKKYKSSINCSNPKGFSQKAHCAGKKKDEDQHPNERPRGPETKPTMPKGTVKVDVSDVYDWYKLGQHLSNLDGLGKHDFGKGPPSTILSFGSEEEEHEYIKALQKTGLSTTDIDPVDPNQPKGMKRQKTDPTYNVNEFAADDDGEEEQSLRKYARIWYNGDFDIQTKVEKILDHMGWEIGEIESEEGGVFVVRSGDENGNSYIGWSAEDLTNIDETNFGGQEVEGNALEKFKDKFPNLSTLMYFIPGFGQKLMIADMASAIQMYNQALAKIEQKYPEQTIQTVQQKVGDAGEAWEPINENFADGRNPQDKGDSKRHGISKGMSIAQLKKIRSSDSASPRKKQLAHWQINMRQGKKK